MCKQENKLWVKIQKIKSSMINYLIHKSLGQLRLTFAQKNGMISSKRTLSRSVMSASCLSVIDSVCPLSIFR